MVVATLCEEVVDCRHRAAVVGHIVVVADIGTGLVAEVRAAGRLVVATAAGRSVAAKLYRAVDNSVGPCAGH